MPVTQAPPASTAVRPYHRHYVYHHRYRHMARHYTHRMPSRAAATPGKERKAEPRRKAGRSPEYCAGRPAPSVDLPHDDLA
jgi:hypothetical protein